MYTKININGKMTKQNKNDLFLKNVGKFYTLYTVSYHTTMINYIAFAKLDTKFNEIKSYIYIYV